MRDGVVVPSSDDVLEDMSGSVSGAIELFEAEFCEVVQEACDVGIIVDIKEEVGCSQRRLMSQTAAMESKNLSTVTVFILEGFTTSPDLQVLLFLLFLAIYALTLFINIIILIIIYADARLHKPMYFFLGSLSFLDLGYASSTSPKMLVDFVIEKKTITFLGCVAQIFIFVGFGSTEFFLLAVMAFDRYVAICKPLMYTVTMKSSACMQLISGSFVCGFIHSLITAGGLFQLSFCGPNKIDHFACDLPAFLKLSCSSITINELILSTLTTPMMGGSLFVVLVSYTYIVIAITRIHTVEGRHRACSTCASHFICVLMFYGTVLFIYLRPNSSYSAKKDNVVSVFYMFFTPMLNPLIYSLRNKEVKETVKYLLCRKKIS
ncbi:olfactory receptor 5A1-like [Pleurodeles waltl]|uniref:olfactory receptor 5A1-like n=1 Tax=Pleurodeles waltl TaxID=8319 RepID=UPI00370976EA